jgi:uncharacterized protein YciI
MAEDLVDHRRIFNRGDDLQGAAAVRAVFHVDIEDTFEQPGPTHARRFSLTLGVIGRGLGGTLCRSGNDFTAQLRVGRQHAVGFLSPGVSRPVSAAMYVIELIYKADLADIDANMGAHVSFLKKYYASGHFLVSDRKIPRDGGIILAVGKSRAQIQAIVEEDPFYERGLADFRIIEFRASQRADDIQQRIESGSPRQSRRR